VPALPPAHISLPSAAKHNKGRSERKLVCQVAPRSSERCRAPDATCHCAATVASCSRLTASARDRRFAAEASFISIPADFGGAAASSVAGRAAFALLMVSACSLRATKASSVLIAAAAVVTSTVSLAEGIGGDVALGLAGAA